MTRGDQISGPDPWPMPRALRRALVVDDSLSERRLLRLLLERWGYDCDEAASAGEALEVCAQAEFDLVLSDWMMPDRTGLDLARAFRKIERRTYGYFILLTTKSESSDVALGYECGADDFITKPLDPDGLRARLLVAERIVGMQRRLADQNTALSGALERITELNAAVDRDLQEARRLQGSLAPDRTLRLPHGVAATALRAAGHVGGDLVGLIPLPDEGRIGVYGIDVSGHGIASALLAARLAGQLAGPASDRSLSFEDGPDGTVRLKPPVAICRDIDRRLARDIGTDHFATACIADCDLATGTVHLALAGHPRPAVLRRDGGIEWLGDGGNPLGLIPDPWIGEVTTVLAPGDRLVIHSDGLADAAGLDEEELATLFAPNQDMAADDFLRAVFWEVEERAGGRALPDDISMVVVDRG